LYVPSPRFSHLFASPVNVFLRNLEAKGALTKLDIEESEAFSVSRIEEVT
jgi:hypothetical protein